MGFISDIGRTKSSALSNVNRGFSLFCLLVIISCQQSKCTYLNQIAVHIEGGSHIADRIATKHGYTNMGQVCIPIFVISHTCYCLFHKKISLKWPLSAIYFLIQILVFNSDLYPCLKFKFTVLFTISS